MPQEMVTGRVRVNSRSGMYNPAPRLVRIIESLVHTGTNKTNKEMFVNVLSYVS